MKKAFTKLELIVVLTIIVLIAYPLTLGLISISNPTFVEIIVKDKESVVTGDSSKYLIFSEVIAEDSKIEEVFENSDSAYYKKFNSSDLYNKIEPGQRYTVKVSGKRMPLFSAYRNIIKIMPGVDEFQPEK